MKNYPLVLFDGVCILCNGTVDFIIKKDKERKFRFVPLQSDAGIKLIERFNIPPDIDSVILINNNQIYLESDAALEIVRQLANPWKLLYAFKIIPQKLRDGIYRWIAKNRYNWFGTKKVCRVAKSGEKELFPELADLDF